MNEHPKYTRREDLPPDRREKLEFIEDLLGQLPKHRFVRRWARSVSANCHKSPRDGFSVINLVRLYYRWQRSGKDWRALDKYHALETDTLWLLKRHGLTPAKIQKWLRRGQRTQLAKKHGLFLGVVNQVLNGESASKRHTAFVADVAREILGEQKAVQFQLAEYELCLKRIQKPLKTMLARVRKLRRKLNNQSDAGLNEQ